MAVTVTYANRCEFPCGECAACRMSAVSADPAADPQFRVCTARRVARRADARTTNSGAPPEAILHDAARPWLPSGGPWTVAQVHDVIAALQAWLERVDPPIDAEN